MLSFIHLSDLHIRKKIRKSENQNLKKIIAYINNRHGSDNEKPIILITGDIVHNGCKKEYENAVEMLSEFRNANFELLVCPGNHDYGLRGNFYTENAQARYLTHIHGTLLGNDKARNELIEIEELFPVVTPYHDSKVVFFGLDSIESIENMPLHFAMGCIGKDQRSELIGKLTNSAFSNYAKIVYFHHHLYCDDPGHLMLDASKVNEILKYNGADVICCGHEHESLEIKTDFFPVYASGKTTKRNKEKNNKFQYRMIKVEPGKDPVAELVEFDLD